MSDPRGRYIGTEYLDENPTWDQEDSPWKSGLVMALLEAHGLRPGTICEVGCGAGFVLADLKTRLQGTELFGFDIAPALLDFWKRGELQGIHFQLGDFASVNKRHYDLILVLDVIEHVPDPFGFLTGLRASADNFIFHIPLDLSAVTIAREKPLLSQRRHVGHIHYYTKNLALTLLAESGFTVVEARYTGAAFAAPRPGWKTRLARLPRRLARIPNDDFGVRLLGGETLIVLASPTSGAA